MFEWNCDTDFVSARESLVIHLLHYFLFYVLPLKICIVSKEKEKRVVLFQLIWIYFRGFSCVFILCIQFLNHSFYFHERKTLICFSIVIMFAFCYYIDDFVSY